MINTTNLEELGSIKELTLKDKKLIQKNTKKKSISHKTNNSLKSRVKKRFFKKLKKTEGKNYKNVINYLNRSEQHDLESLIMKRSVPFTSLPNDCLNCQKLIKNIGFCMTFKCSVNIMNNLTPMNTTCNFKKPL